MGLLSLGVSAQFDFDAAIDLLGKRVARKIYEQGKSKVAVANLYDHHGEENELGMLVSEELTVSMLKHSLGFEVMDRAHLAAIFSEHKLALGGLMNDSTIIQLGRLESVEVLITGTVVKLGDKYKVTVKALDTETAMVIAADKEYFSSERYLDAYYGIASTLPDPIVPDPVVIIEDDCSKGRFGSIYMVNTKSLPLLVSLSHSSASSSCRDEYSVEIPAGGSHRVTSFCSGNVNYLARDSYSGNILGEGTIYLYSCSEKSVKL
jgi:TolB-like protein